jgi:16S rRNA G966 N2-methylase RsmD
MNIFRSFSESIKDRGVTGTFLVTFLYFLDFFFDLKYGTDTFSWVELNDLKIESQNISRGERYQPTHTLPLRKLFNHLQIPTGKTLVDLGSGKCKVLLVAAEYGFKNVRGVEFSKELCEIAEQNFKAFSKKHPKITRFEVIHADVGEYQYRDDEDVFYLFNPFDDVVLLKVMKNISASLKRRNRKILIIYFNALHKNIIENSQFFAKLGEYKNLGQEFLIYTSE